MYVHLLQIARILHPIVQTVQSLPELARDPILGQCIEEQFKGVKTAQLAILSDFFRHGFDGSGDDGGSCIDGRLTSTWNWCSNIEKKPFYPLFLLAGFEGFNGHDF